MSALLAMSISAITINPLFAAQCIGVESVYIDFYNNNNNNKMLIKMTFKYHILLPIYTIEVMYKIFVLFQQSQDCFYIIIFEFCKKLFSMWVLEWCSLEDSLILSLQKSKSKRLFPS